ncbi:MAG: histidine kinase, partial [Prolixibacteraceae bacterium]|nr:histidine kinase [Prolixibacteraceae bacterium]
LPLFANGYLFGWFEKHFIDWIRKPFKSVLLALLMHLIYSSTVIFTVNWFWFIYFEHQEWDNFWIFNKGTIISEYVIFVIIAAIIYAISFFKAWRFQVSESEKIKSEALSLKYQVLQNQVNPHFLFNSLNILGSLIDIDTEKAKEFTRGLSHFYRDVLHFKDQDIISLKEEIEFVRKYIYLQQIRFGKSLEVEIIANENIKGNVIPLSLQTLVENAIKHNEISQANPLSIVIAITDDYELIVENNSQPKNVTEAGSGTGLKNLAGRYEFLTGKEVVITQNEKYFRVKLPLILIDQPV